MSNYMPYSHLPNKGIYEEKNNIEKYMHRSASFKLNYYYNYYKLFDKYVKSNGYRCMDRNVIDEILLLAGIEHYYSVAIWLNVQQCNITSAPDMSIITQWNINITPYITTNKSRNGIISKIYKIVLNVQDTNHSVNYYRKILHNIVCYNNKSIEDIINLDMGENIKENITAAVDDKSIVDLTKWFFPSMNSKWNWQKPVLLYLGNMINWLPGYKTKIMVN